MPRWFFASLRSRAIILVLLAIIPLFALTFYSYLEHRRQAVAEVQRDEEVASRNLAITLETLIRSTRQLLDTLAQLPQVQLHNREGCNALFAELLEQGRHYTFIVAADLDGRVFAGAPVGRSPVNVAGYLWFQQVIQTRAFFVGEPLLDPISGRQGFSLSFPILDDRGRLHGAIVAALDLDWLGSLLAKSDLAASAGLVLTDATWKVLFRYPEPLKYTGKMLPAPVIKAMAAQDNGVLESVGLPGDLRLLGFTRLAPPWQNLRVVIDLPKEPAFDQVNRELQRNLAWLAIVALLAMVAARFGGNLFIIQPVDKLLEVTRRLSEGDLAARTGPPYKAGELGRLAQAFDHMVDSLQGRDAELKRVVEELKKRVRELDERTAQLEAANKEMGDFTYTVSHDLRAPLRAIGGFARVLLEDYPDKLDEDGRRYLNIIQQEARKMGQLIDDLLALTRLGRKGMDFRPIDMAELARDIVKEFQDVTRQRRLQIDIEPLPQASGDRAMMRLVWDNLLLNAIKFTQTRETAVIRVSGWSEDREEVYCVKDNGVGFDMKYANKLFEVFQRLHPEAEFAGTGVGLAIVKRIIDRHGGRVWAEGKVDEGSAFYFTIPKRIET